MRIKIILSADKSGIIDFNYQHQLQAIIYEFLSKSNPDYSSWLHEQGYVYKNDKRFKFFVFSGITFHKQIKIISSNCLNGLHGLNCSEGFSFKASQTNPFTFSFQIASPVDKFIQHLIDGIFREGNEITLGRQQVTIHRVETLPDPLNSLNSLNGSSGLSDLNRLNGSIGLNLRPLESPIFIKKPMPYGQHDVFLFPGDEDYKELLNQNLIHKYNTLYGKPFEGEPLKFDFHAIKGKSVKQFTIFKKGLDGSTKPINIKGTLQSFTVTGPKELIRIGLECGFGQNNSMGCGYVEMNRDGQDRQDNFVKTQYLASLKQR
ncbi:MAG: CRISPR-associated endoribonuclease Cas6 [Candidatus Brocadia sp. AMX2]|uniref:CRISPR associated protein Cas6 C-terminal domain-containing protein n=1 Tax=Candidatus Brocadia sinica JPN1 TaxID=1197129 RepID=A0ABQ0JSZ6_9BACT|nr:MULTISPECIES: CRISPR-associated endoribonuclease Cas6 [Brocadia]KXK28541.1 MAG: CRISPR-associated protein [Candidatus Brocadia sinica]MBC6931648.1 CRISPR-associated endoribonuclease Cas6 [Candidatus Brocadia sp.]MBL1168987.1 CRISPR-associated endoribonuclease Cas6 [Candidatus Brocadia sp. AMX1]NOG43422.1 CRISPR-associated endoribonuclease Cas6 [Planctomycetota bacterium]KAA0245246.1 MAG: CRISPR-associated endoribonuclease Cas6 [Candidatus Brocadia sp. AMX2]